MLMNILQASFAAERHTTLKLVDDSIIYCVWAKAKCLQIIHSLNVFLKNVYFLLHTQLSHKKVNRSPEVQ